MTGIAGHPMAKAAVEMALLDAELRSTGESLASHLGSKRESVQVGVAVGLHEDVGALLAAVSSRLDEGYGRVKLKVEPGRDVEPVAAVRAEFGADLMLQVDANGAYDPHDLAPLEALDDYGLLLIEQPFSADDLLAHARLEAAIATSVCLDESVTSLASAAQAIEIGACSTLNLKPGRVGGYLESVRIHDLCVEAGVQLWCGGMLEMGLGRAGNLALAGLPGFTLPGDISATNRYFDTDITRSFELVDGALNLPTGPGLGVEPDLEKLERFGELTVELT
jgi:O-succinylbenzoate synthase